MARKRWTEEQIIANLNEVVAGTGGFPLGLGRPHSCIVGPAGRGNSSWTLGSPTTPSERPNTLGSALSLQDAGTP